MMIFAWDLGVNFLGAPNWEIGGFSQKNIYLLCLVLKLSQKYVWVVSSYTYFKGFCFRSKGIIGMEA